MDQKGSKASFIALLTSAAIPVASIAFLLMIPGDGHARQKLLIGLLITGVCAVPHITHWYAKIAERPKSPTQMRPTAKLSPIRPGELPEGQLESLIDNLDSPSEWTRRMAVQTLV